MKNQMIGQHEAADIDKIASKIIKGVGANEPPLNLDDVRELLSLDKQYYNSSDESLFREFVSRVIVAGKQVVRRPTLLIDVIRKADLSALYLPDRRRILIDQNTPPLKHRWNEAHEIGHGVIPWHADFLFGDTEFSLDPVCHEHLEAEANYAAGRLLFLGSQFREEALQLSQSLDTVRSLTKRYGNTLTSTLWRYVEQAHNGKPMLAMVSQHPWFSGAASDTEQPCRHFIQSPTFQNRFSNVTAMEVYSEIKSYCEKKRGGPLGNNHVTIRDDNGDFHKFYFESFSNTHYVLTLGVHRKGL